MKSFHNKYLMNMFLVSIFLQGNKPSSLPESTDWRVFSITYTSPFFPLSSFHTIIKKAELSFKWVPLKWSEICHPVVKRVNNVNFLTWIDFNIIEWVFKDGLIFHIIDN